ncbi:MAG: DUF523 domain-containing protein [Candidatus Micrarchaeota archaeon]|nr:DUF523 domain-containing protein [Candidatus Micrarchaeota archaeon]
MEKDKKVIFVSHCLLNQNVKASGREIPDSAVRELLGLFAEAGVGIVQIPCPQVEFGAGIQRKPASKSSYDTEKYRSQCRKLSKMILKQIESYLKANYKVLAILGVEFSPSCAVYQIENGNRSVPGKGIFIEEFENEMRKKKFQIPIIGVNPNNMYSTIEKIQTLLRFS